MLFPEDPVKRPSLWQSVTTQLGHEKFCFLVDEGVGNPMAEARTPTAELVDKTIERLRAAAVCRIGASRGVAVSPHFAGQLDGSSIRLTEFMALAPEGSLHVNPSQMQRDLETAVINLLYMGEGIKSVAVPLQVPPWSMKDARIESTADGLIFHKM